MQGETVAVQLLAQRLDQLERQFEQHCRSQNSHLLSIDTTLGKLAETISENRTERSEQIGELKSALEESFATLYQRALFAVVPIGAGLLYIIFNHVLQK